MSVIRGTGDARKMKDKGQVVGQTVSSMRCPKCSQTAVQTRNAQGDVIYHCVCGAQFKTQRF